MLFFHQNFKVLFTDRKSFALIAAYLNHCVIRQKSKPVISLPVQFPSPDAFEGLKK